MMLSWLWSDPLPVGTHAPAFSLPDESGNIVSLEAFQGRNVVLVFYPGDDTTVCTRQLCEFRDQWQEARARNVEVLGINPWSRASHAKFREKFQFPFPILVDKGQKVGKLYHAHGLIVKRTVYLIGPGQTVRFARRGTPSVAEVLSAGA